MTKQEILNEIARKLSIVPVHVSTGSTEPKDFLEKVAERLGLSEVILGLSKPDLAAFIAVSLAQEWDSTCFSEGSTVTKEGLQRILDGLESF